MLVTFYLSSEEEDEEKNRKFFKWPLSWMNNDPKLTNFCLLIVASIAEDFIPFLQ
jgi:hypothetical protein